MEHASFEDWLEEEICFHFTEQELCDKLVELLSGKKTVNKMIAEFRKKHKETINADA